MMSHGSQYNKLFRTQNVSLQLILVADQQYLYTEPFDISA